MAAEKSARLHASTTPGAQAFRVAFTCRGKQRSQERASRQRRTPCLSPLSASQAYGSFGLCRTTCCSQRARGQAPFSRRHRTASILDTLVLCFESSDIVALGSLLLVPDELKMWKEIACGRPKVARTPAILEHLRSRFHQCRYNAWWTHWVGTKAEMTRNNGITRKKQWHRKQGRFKGKGKKVDRLLVTEPKPETGSASFPPRAREPGISCADPWQQRLLAGRRRS